MLLVLEDLHWADRSTRDLLTFLSRVLHREKVAVVVTYRTDDLHRRHPLRPVVAELLRLPGVTAIELAPLGYADMADHLSALAAGPLDAATLHRIVTRAEGNPYYGEELLRGAARSRWPPGTAGRLARRPGREARAAHRARRPAARPVRAGVRHRPAGAAGGARWPGGHARTSMIREASGLAEAELRGGDPGGGGPSAARPGRQQGYTFRHALIREAIYGDLLPGERTRLHARFAELLADPDRLATVPGTAAELAHHCLASHDITGAFAASVRAAQEAERLAAPAEAHRHYDARAGAVGAGERAGAARRAWTAAMLAFRSANRAAASGEVARAVQQLRRLRGCLGEPSDPALASRVRERLAYFLLEMGAAAEAEAAAQAAVGHAARRTRPAGSAPGRWPPTPRP